MKRRRLGFLLLWCFMCMTCQAQKNGDMPFSVVIRDGSTGEVVWYANALLLDADSAVVDTLKCDKVLRKSSMEYEYSGILPKSGKYILKCTFDRLFTPLFFPFEVTADGEIARFIHEKERCAPSTNVAGSGGCCH